MARPRLRFMIPGTRNYIVPLAPSTQERHERGPVEIPEGRCVYWWVGCTGKRYGISETMCRAHFYEAKGWKPSEGKVCPRKDCDRLANKMGGYCTRCYWLEYNRMHPELRAVIDRRYLDRKKEGNGKRSSDRPGTG